MLDFYLCFDVDVINYLDFSMCFDDVMNYDKILFCLNWIYRLQVTFTSLQLAIAWTHQPNSTQPNPTFIGLQKF